MERSIWIFFPAWNISQQNMIGFLIGYNPEYVEDFDGRVVRDFKGPKKSSTKFVKILGSENNL